MRLESGKAPRTRLPAIGRYQRQDNEYQFVSLKQDALSHAGLVLAKLLPGHDSESAGKRRSIDVAREAVRHLGSASPQPAGIYAQCFARRKQSQVPNSLSFELTTPVGTRLVLGLGNASPLETGLTLDHTYGVPIIPGSAIKGVASHYFLANHQDQSQVHQLLFGDTEQSGFIAFHDAWISPESLARDDGGLLRDVMTPHHGDYYGENKYDSPNDGERNEQFIPPTSFDDPTPVPFVSVRGTFYFIVSWNDGSPLAPELAEQRLAWLTFVQAIVVAALDDWGIGGKTSSGYGRLSASVKSAMPTSGKKTPQYKRGDEIKVVCIQPASGSKKAKFRADDDFVGHIPDNVQPSTNKDETIILWVANVSSNGYTFSTKEPNVKQHQAGKLKRK